MVTKNSHEALLIDAPGVEHLRHLDGLHRLDLLAVLGAPRLAARSHGGVVHTLEHRAPLVADEGALDDLAPAPLDQHADAALAGPRAEGNHVGTAPLAPPAAQLSGQAELA